MKPLGIDLDYKIVFLCSQLVFSRPVKVLIVLESTTLREISFHALIER